MMVTPFALRAAYAILEQPGEGLDGLVCLPPAEVAPVVCRRVPAAGLRVQLRRRHAPARQPGEGSVDAIPRGEAGVVRHPDMMTPRPPGKWRTGARG
jgi:hypothetical protein